MKPQKPLLRSAALLVFVAARILGAQDSVAAHGRIATAARVLAPFIEHERTANAIPAISIAIVDGGHVAWARGFGWADSAANRPATASTVYRVGSVSKLFTDIGIMRLVEAGKLSLDAPITQYLPDFHPKNPFGGVITIRELSAHRSGLTREPPVGNYFDDTNPSLAATVSSLNATTLVYKPGTHTKYSNAGIAVLGDVLERTQGESFYPYLEHAVLAPMGLASSAFRPTVVLAPRLATASMWTLDGRRFPAPTFQLGMGPCGSMYSTVLDLGRFAGILIAKGVTPNGTRVLSAAMIDSMWTPQFATPGAKTGYGIGFNVGTLDGHRTVGHDGAIYGFATTLLILPDDSLGVVVTATLDGANAVTDHIARAALTMLMQGRGAENGVRGPANGDIAAVQPTIALSRDYAQRLVGRYVGTTSSVDLEEFEGHLYLTPNRGGSRAELRVPAGGDPARASELIQDDVLSYGERVTLPGADRVVLGGETFTRTVVADRRLVPVVQAKPPIASEELAPLVGEYGPDYDVLYIREKDGRLNAVIEQFFEYPLERVSRDVYRFPSFGLYDGQEIVFHRDAAGRVTEAVAATVPFKRRDLPLDDDHINARIQAVRPPAELRREALAAHPPVEPAGLRAMDLVELRSLDSTIHYDIRYATSNNFMGTPFYTSAHAFMQRPAADAVVRAAAELRKLGVGLLIHDAYRPWYVTKMFWDGTPPDKHIFVADPSQGSRHNRGCAVDLTLYDLETGAPIRMTGGYDEMTDRSYPLYPGGTSSQRWHRDLLRHMMEAQGFTVYEAEWWHFDYKDFRSYPIGNKTFEQLAGR